MENERPWLPKELRPYPYARRMLGLVLRKGQKPPRGLKVKKAQVYYQLWKEKVLELLQNDPDPENALRNLLPRWEPQHPDDQSARLENFLENPEWKGPGIRMREYLRGTWKLNDLVDNLDLQRDQDVDDETFLKELKSLNLAEFLEDVM